MFQQRGQAFGPLFQILGQQGAELDVGRQCAPPSKVFIGGSLGNPAAHLSERQDHLLVYIVFLCGSLELRLILCGNPREGSSYGQTGGQQHGQFPQKL